MMRSWKSLLPVTLLLVAFLLFAACSDDDDDDDTATNTPGGVTTPGDDDDDDGDEDDGDDEATEVGVSLMEFAVAPDAASAPAGDIRFVVMNDGTTEHEFYIIRSDLAEDALPTNDEGEVDTDADGLELIDEIEEFASGEMEEIEVDLSAGAYVLICNRPTHYEQGMHAAFTVN